MLIETLVQQKTTPNEATGPNYTFNSSSLLSFFFRWKLIYAVSILLSVIAAIVFSGPNFITPKFKSVTVLYPSVTNSVSKAVLNEYVDPLSIGYEVEADRLVQLLYSDQIRDSIIKEFDLVNHYKIDINSPIKNTLLHREYAANVKINRTQYMSVEISVMDSDPIKAAGIANRISDLVDHYKLQMVIGNAEKTAEILRFQYENKKQIVNKLNDSLKFLRSLGAYDYNLQADHVTEQYVAALAENISETEKLKVYVENNVPLTDTMVIRTKGRIKGSEAAVKLLEKKLNLLTQYGGAYNMVSNLLNSENYELTTLHHKLERAMIDVRESMPAKFTVSYAQVPEKKAFPIRWLVVLFTVISASLFTTFILVIVDNYKNNANRFGMDG